MHVDKPVDNLTIPPAHSSSNSTNPLTIIVPTMYTMTMPDSVADKILKYLEEEGPKTKEEIMKKLNNHSQYTYLTIREMVVKEKITKVNDKYISGSAVSLLGRREIPLPTDLAKACYHARNGTDPNVFEIDRMREDAIRGIELYLFYMNITREFCPTPEQVDITKFDGLVAQNSLKDLIKPYLKVLTGNAPN